MAYTPTTDFTFSASLYTPSTDFDFNIDQSVHGFLACVLDGVTGKVEAAVATQGRLRLPLVEYTPTTDFKFNASAYTPSKDFTLSGARQKTLDGVTGHFNGHVDIFEAVTYQASLSATLDGVTGSLVAANTVYGRINATLGVTGHFSASFVNNFAHIAATLDGVSGSLSAEFDYNVQRLTVSQVLSVSESGSAVGACHQSFQGNATAIEIDQCSLQDNATVINSDTCFTVDAAKALQTSRCGTVDDATLLTQKLTAVSDVLDIAHNQLYANNQQATPVHAKTRGIFEQMTVLNADAVYSVVEDCRTNLRQETYTRLVDAPNPYTPTPDFIFASDPGYTPTADFFFDVDQSSLEIIVQDVLGVISASVSGSWQSASTLDKKFCSPVEDGGRPPPGTSVWADPPREPAVIPTGLEPFIIPTQNTYIMQHSITVTLIDDTPINMGDISLNLDADAFAWTFSGALLDKDDLPLLQQVDGNPVQLLITINSYQWKVLVERINRGRQFAKNSITVSGRGLSALLGKPYQPLTSATQGSDLSVQQIADLQLPFGWINDWQAPTWLVPGGSYTHSNVSPIQAIKQIAENIGAIVVPHRTEQILKVQPRYPVMPWQFDQVPADVVIPEAVITELTERPTLPAQANGVYVHGNEIAGQIGFCRISGTAGDVLAETSSNQLMTDATGLRALGERVLAGQATQPMIESITIPMDGVDVPLLELGQLVEVPYGGASVKGVINSVSISAEFGRVRQTVQLGEESTNSWVKFKNILPADPLLFATMVSTDGTTSLMTLLGGGVIRVRGTGSPGSAYYIRSGKIDSDAPNMAQSEIVI